MLKWSAFLILIFLNFRPVVALACSVPVGMTPSCPSGQRFDGALTCRCQPITPNTPHLGGPSKANCDIAREKLDKFFNQNSSGCKVDSDCDSYYYRETCRGPVVLPKAIASTEAFQKKLKDYNDEIKINSVCSEEWKLAPACAPRAVAPKCKSGKCIDGLR